MKQRVIIAGGGVIGTMHAWRFIERGFEVVHVERDATPTMASVRNFGLVWVGGRRSGHELDVALQARALWAELAEKAPNLSFRANGSLTIARTEAELKVLEQSMQLHDAESRGWHLLAPAEARMVNPALDGQFLAALHCKLDAAVEPSTVLTSIREHLLATDAYTWVANTEVVDVTESATGVLVAAAHGTVFPGDFAVVCPGADHETLFAGEFAAAPLRRVRLQMFSTMPLGVELTTSIADGDSLRYYPAYDVPALAELPAQHSVADAAKMQLLMVQRTDGTLTIGDTHEYDEPFDFALREPEYDYLIEVAEDILGRRLPKVARRWSGVYSQRTDGAVCDRQFIGKRIALVTGPGGRGNSLSPAIAEGTIREWGI